MWAAHLARRSSHLPLPREAKTSENATKWSIIGLIGKASYGKKGRGPRPSQFLHNLQHMQSHNSGNPSNRDTYAST